jgi:hypothetical protein
MNTCSYKKCKEPVVNNNGALWLHMDGGYGDFVDIFLDEEEEQRTIFLCHKHAHKFSNFLGNGKVLSGYRSTSHSIYSKNNFFHNAWDSHTWGSYLSIFFITLFCERSIKATIEVMKEKYETHDRWTRYDINEKDSPRNWNEFWYRFFNKSWGRSEHRRNNRSPKQIG